jgi:predicted aconitase with swiveling domain
VLVAGSARGPLLKLAAPLSFWGGVSPTTGTITQPRHPDHGRCIAGVVLAIASPIGSSSSSSVLLELIRNGRAPVAIVLGQADAILVVGCFVARELKLEPPPVLVVPAAVISGLAEGQYAIERNGAMRLLT